MAWVDLRAGDGHALQAWCAAPGPVPGTGRRAVVILQEIFGVNSHIRKVCDQWAAQGWLAIAPALFDRVARGTEAGYTPEGVALGMATKAAVSTDSALLDVQAAIDLGRSRATHVAVIGFCWGGTLAWLAASRLNGLRAAVAYYGTQIEQHIHEAPRVPVQLHFGEQDTHIPSGHVQRIAQAWPQLALYLYPTGHGFNCDDRPAFHAQSAAMAASRTFSFLEDSFSC